MDTLGSSPVTQVTRDQIAQADHDKLVEYGIMLKNIMDGQLRLEGQIKDLIQGQATALATWETKSQVVHDAQDIRLKKLEDLAILYVPMGDQLKRDVDSTRVDVQSLKDNKNQLVGGWKGIVLLFGSIGGSISTIYLFIQLISHICLSSCH